VDSSLVIEKVLGAKCEEITGYTSLELIGKRISSLVIDHEGLAKLLNHLKERLLFVL